MTTTGQKFSVFIKAGYNAFRMAYGTGFFGFDGKVVQSVNPFKQHPHASLWQKGWDKAKSDWERNRPNNPDQFVDNRVIRDPKDRQQTQQRKQQAQSRFNQQQKAKHKGQAGQKHQYPRPTSGPVQHKPQQRQNAPATPANLQRLSNRLTNKFRTVA